MKLYKVLMGNGRTAAHVVADRWLEDDGRILFYCGDKPVDDQYFLKASVVSITVEQADYDPDAQPPRIFPATDETGYF